MNNTILAVLALTAVMGGSARAADDPLDTAKQLYLSAAYEEALVTLGNLPQGADADQADKFRALCLLALNRPDEAGKALESLAIRRPLLKLDDSESPKLVLMFREARMRVLPPAAKSLYLAAKGNFEKGDLATAKGQFGDLLAVLAEPELSALPETSDMKMLADGFAKLVDQQLSKQAPSPAPGAAPAVAANGAPANTAPARTVNGTAPVRPAARPTPAAAVSVIFTADDAGVIAPVPIEQRLPPWMPPPSLRNESFSGFIEVVIDEAGKVISAVVTRSVNPPYDRLLVGAAKRWQYRPAERDGRPVKFRRVVSVVLSPND